MALSFPGVINQKGNQFVASGSQFDMEATSTKLITFDFTLATEQTVYTVPAGVTLYVSKILLINSDTAAHVWDFFIDGFWFLAWSAAASETKEIDFPVAMPLPTGTVLSCTSRHINNNFALIGWEL